MTSDILCRFAVDTDDSLVSYTLPLYWAGNEMGTNARLNDNEINE